MTDSLPQEFPRDLALTRLEDVLPSLSPAAQDTYAALFAATRQDPLTPPGALLHGDGALLPLMGLMRLLVLRLRERNLDAYETTGARPNYRTAYIRGAGLATPLPARASVLFLERADQAPPTAAAAIRAFPGPLYATWAGPAGGPVWAALAERGPVLPLEQPGTPKT